MREKRRKRDWTRQVSLSAFNALARIFHPFLLRVRKWPTVGVRPHNSTLNV